MGNRIQVTSSPGIKELTGDVVAGPASGSTSATISPGAVTDDKIASGVSATKIADGSISNEEFQTLNGVTSSIQTQLDGKQATGDYATNTSLNNHINDATAAHAASAIASTPSGNLAATDVQTALNELQSDIDTRATSSALTTHISDTAVHGATSSNTVSRIVARDASGNFSAGTITAALSGNATTATSATTATTATNRSFSIAAGLDGQHLYILWTANAGEILDSGIMNLAGTWTPSVGSTLHLICDGINWNEISRSIN